ncbi:DUF4190 domain-containing protein [Metabacillus sp. GX 13764]|uniref:DUF4190 domain-containing protein n=1 Tax=Metabacillus kandeliae TaxID=2900151 RepID=UPI001E39A944|nr:DUF4190 domain-containing protein [Metabacillus kandeliae]MCD7032677.1 DUF4190 domain-containing protein [Metabacillus kandeliae]
METAKKTNVSAIVSLVLGICSLAIPVVGIITGIIGLIFSFKSTKEIRFSGEEGHGMAIAGRVCSIIGLAISLLVLILFVFVGVISFFVPEDMGTYDSEF